MRGHELAALPSARPLVQAACPSLRLTHRRWVAQPIDVDLQSACTYSGMRMCLSEIAHTTHYRRFSVTALFCYTLDDAPRSDL